MKCLICGRWNRVLICLDCFPSLDSGVRLVDEMSVYSFYALSEIEFLIHFKYRLIGSRVFALLSKRAGEYFFSQAGSPHGVCGVGIDDRIQGGYSHTGVIMHGFKSCGIRPQYGALKAKNEISYAGKSLDFRLSNPKGFQSHLSGRDIVLFDDVITTGTTLKEAKNLLQAQGNRVLFAITLCDARR